MTRILALVLLALVTMCGSVRAGGSLRPARHKQIIAAYHGLTPADIAKHPAKVAADQTFIRIDVSDRMRSASFGRKTFVLVPASKAGHEEDPNVAEEFYVEYGRSTNAAGGMFGPFTIPPAP